MKNVIGILMILVSTVAQAEWLCTETSSIKTGNTITACGVAKSANLDKARELARENAVKEFNQLCRISSDCNQFDYNVVPKRTECKIQGSEILCYRAIDFEITEHLKSDTSIDKDQIQKDLDQTKTQIQDLQQKIYVARQLQAAKMEVEIKNRQLKNLEGRDIKLREISNENEYSPDSYNFFSSKSTSALKFGVSYWDAKLTSDSEADLGLTLSYEVKATNWLGLQLDLTHGGDMGASNNEASNKGTPGTTETFKGGMTFNSLSASALVYTGIFNTYLKGEFGVVQGVRQINTVTYSPVGTGASQKSEVTVSKTFSGVSLGYDTRENNKGWGTYMEVGARAVGSNIGATTSIGLAFGF